MSPDNRDEGKRSDGSCSKPIDTVKVHSEFKTNKPNMLNLYVGDIVYVFSKAETGWWDGVVFTDNGAIRGWFPSTHTRSIPLNSNQSSEILAKSPSATGSVPHHGILKNTGIINNSSNSNFNQLLRSNLDSAFSNKQRKNSSVSFASSENSYQSNNNQGNSTFIDSNLGDGVFDKAHNLSIVEPISPIINIDKVKLVSAQEAESIFSSIGSSNVPIWSPIATTNGSIIYYNSELNIYCKELPYIETPEINDNSKIAITSNTEDPIPLSVINLNQAFHDRGVQNIRNRPSTVSYSDRKDSSRASIKSRSSLPSTTTNTIHPWNTSLYCLPGLFYYDPTDIKTWPALRDTFLYFANLTEDALNKKSGSLFFTYFNITSRLGVLMNLAARLAQHDLQKSGYQNRVQKRLKKISSSIAQIGINGNLYLTETESSSEFSEMDRSSALGNRNFSTSTQETVKFVTKYEVEGEAEDYYQGTNSTFEKNSRGQVDYLHQVQIEMSNMKRSAISCVKIFIQISSNQFNDQSYLPQIYPRFLSGFFSGGNWRNPFVPEPTDPFAGKEVVKSLHEKRLPKVNLNKETLEILEFKRDELKVLLEDVLIQIRDNEPSRQRNVEILAKIHKSLPISTKYIDLLEGLDFSIFSNAKRNHSKANISLEDEFDPSKLIYLVLTEFFESKQEVRDLCVMTVMEAQNLTLSDQTVFKSIKEDSISSTDKFANLEPERTAKQLEQELYKVDVENSNGIYTNNDTELEYVILRAFDLCDISIALVQQLISEKDSLLNYATRVMNDDFTNFDLISNAHREDSTVTNDEYALPASTTNRHGIIKEVPWYLESEEYNLIFTNNDTVKGGTREALIQRLTHHDLLDASFNLTFLITFRSMMTTTALMELLIKRFNIAPPENLSYEEYTDWVEKKSYPIKLRVVNIMMSLLLRYWTPSYNEPSLIQLWSEFIDTLTEQKFPGSEQLAREFDEKVLNYEVTDQYLEASSTSTKDFSSKVKRIKLLEVDHVDFANQLTIKESTLYSRITQMECLDKSWNNKYGSLGGFKNLQAFISNSNDLTNFVSTQIVKYSDVKKRVNVIRFFVNVAEKCRQLKNFSSMTAIVSALYSSPIHRLKKTWDSVPQNILNVLNKLNDLMNSSRNFSEYREHLRFISDKPCVPFLGVFLSDLTFTTNGNPDHLHGDSKLVNFAKRSKTVDILREMSRYQNVRYNLKNNDEIQDYISYRLTRLLMIDEQYNLSLAIEPRVRVSQQLQNISGLTMHTSSSKGSVSSTTIVKGRSGRYFG